VGCVHVWAALSRLAERVFDIGGEEQAVFNLNNRRFDEPTERYRIGR